MSDPGHKASSLRWTKRHPILLFISLFGLQVLLFYVLYINDWFQSHVFGPLVNVYASFSGKILNLLGQQTTVFGDTISSSRFSVGIKQGCDAAEPMVLLIAGILAFPSSLKKKIYGLLTGLLILFVLNIVRIISLYFIGASHPELFDTMHLEVWQVIFIIIAFALWFFWLQAGRTKLSA